jgi:hypothetical protein
MMAQKRAMPVEEYAWITSFPEFLGEVSAWYASFMTPLNTVMSVVGGAFGGESSGSSSNTKAPRRSSSRVNQIKSKYAGKKVTFHDIDTPQGQAALLYGNKIHGLPLVDTRPTPARAPTKRLF